MTPQIRDVVIECTKASDEERITFPQVVAQLMQAGIERYHADFERSEKTYFLPSGKSEVVASAVIDAEPAREFSAEDVAAAIKAIQSGAIRYKEFCSRVMAAGCVGYIVSLAGRRAVYYGRTGDMHVEWFPGARN